MSIISKVLGKKTKQSQNNEEVISEQYTNNHQTSAKENIEVPSKDAKVFIRDVAFCDLHGHVRAVLLATTPRVRDGYVVRSPILEKHNGGRYTGAYYICKGKDLRTGVVEDVFVSGRGIECRFDEDNPLSAADAIKAAFPTACSFDRQFCFFTSYFYVKTNKNYIEKYEELSDAVQNDKLIEISKILDFCDIYYDVSIKEEERKKELKNEEEKRRKEILKDYEDNLSDDEKQALKLSKF